MLDLTISNGIITDRNKRSLQAYLSDIGHKAPTREQEQVLFKEYFLAKNSKSTQKATRLRHEITERNLAFVVSVAKNYQAQISLIDAISYGNEGLMRAIDHFEPERGNRFITYASWWIRQSITRGIDENNAKIHVPKSTLEVMSKARRLENEYGVEAAKSKIKRLVRSDLVRHVPRSFVSIDEPSHEGGSKTLEETLQSDTDLNSEIESNELSLILSHCLSESLDRLSENHRKIISMHYGLNGYKPMTLSQIGEKFGLTRERIRQIEEVGMKKLKRIARCNPGISPILTEAYSQL